MIAYARVELKFDLPDPPSLRHQHGRDDFGWGLARILDGVATLLASTKH
jgi:hypothetical protein